MLFENEIEKTHFSPFLQCPNVGVGSFYHLPLFKKHINSCRVLNWSIHITIKVKSITNVSNNEEVDSGCMCYRLSLK